MKIFLLILVLILLAGSISIAEAALPVEEAALLDGGGAYEVNPDSEGRLWISDYGAGEVWRINPTTGEYIRYTTGGSPADARSSSGLFWWVGNGTNLIGRAIVDTGAFTLWEVPGASSLYGTALDDSGGIWVSDETQPFIYRLAVNTPGESGEICTYSLPDFGMTNYMVYQDPYLLIGDYMNYRLLRLNVDNNTYVWWQLPDFSDPFGMAFDAQGDLWYADLELGLLAELDPDAYNLTSYPIPVSNSFPRMIAIQGMRIWYTTYTTTMGALDTTAADYTRTEVTEGSGTLTPNCEPAILHPLDYDHPSRTMNMIPGTYTWSERSYESIVETGGWQIYQVPPDGIDPYQIFPNTWGITYQNGKVWVVDNGRQKLVEVDSPPNAAELTLTLTGTPATYDSVGDVINYIYLLTNSGSVDLIAPFTVSATNVTNETCPDSPTSLSPGGSITCTGSYTIMQADLDAGSVISISTAKAFSGITPINSNIDSTRTELEYKVFLPLILR